MANPVVHQIDASRSLDDLSRDELIELLEHGHEGRITIDFKGKANARQLARHVRPRILRRSRSTRLAPRPTVRAIS